MITATKALIADSGRIQRSLVTVLANYPLKKKIQQSHGRRGLPAPGIVAVCSRTAGIHGASRHA
jgi:hypothetical protein